MLFIKQVSEPNGAHDNFCANEPIHVPDGYALVREDFEQQAMSLLPFVKLTVTDGIVTAIEDNTTARTAWEALPKPEITLDPLSEMRLAVAELATVAAQKDAENKLAIAELAEAMMGGTK